MSKKINIFTLHNLVNYSSEQIILFGLLNDLKNINIDSTQFNYNNQSRYEGVIKTCKTLFNYVENVEDCDIIVLPYKYKGNNDNIFNILYGLSKQHNKKLYIFFNDDYDKKLFYDEENVKIFRTSFYKSLKQNNEFSIPAFSPDYFENNILIEPKLSIGYCGHRIHNREKYINLFEKSDINTDFILRNGFWAPGVDKNVARKEYIENINNNLFTFCYRGAGNFSYRFYDILMMGRIPILINTDCVFPFENNYDLKDHCIIFDEKELNNVNIIEEIKKYYNKNKDNLIEIQKNNRLLWEKYYSCIGFLQNIYNNYINN